MSEGVQGHAQYTELWKADGVSQGTCLDRLLVFIQGHCSLRVTLSLTPEVLLHSAPGKCVWVLFCLPLGASCFHHLGGRGRKSRQRKRAEIQPTIRRPDMAVAKLFQMNTLAPPSRLGNSFMIMLSQASEDTLVEPQFCRTHADPIAQRRLLDGENRSLYGSTCCGSFHNPRCTKTFLLCQNSHSSPIASKAKPPP